MSSVLQRLQFVQWAVMEASPAPARPDDCLRALYESCTNSDMVGRV